MNARVFLIILAVVFVGIVGFSLIKQSKEPFKDIVTSDMEISGIPRHPITDEMKEDAIERRDKEAKDFTLPYHRGGEMTLSKLVEKTPVVVIMTKDGCPCSIESQPYFNAISTAFKDKVQFIGIIDADLKIAEDYEYDFNVPYPILSSPDEKFFKSWESKQSVYTFLISKDRVVKHVWPGYSETSLHELVAAASKEAGVQAPELEFEHASEEMTSGCFFFKPIGWDPSKDE